VRQLSALNPDITVGVEADLGSQQFQVDVVVIRKHRLYLISCTVENRDDRIGKAICKSKLFEVAMRARQLGGDLARSALVCLLEKKVPELQGEVSTTWDAPNVPRVFGLAHLREWFGYGGEQPMLDRLEEWLSSKK
jgi:hypothetical protein